MTTKKKVSKILPWGPNKKDHNYRTVAVWQGTKVTPEQVNDVKDFFLKVTRTRIKPIGCVTTQPGGRIDFAMLIHREDVSKFSTQRFKLGDDAPKFLRDVIEHFPGIYPLQFLRAYANS